MLNPTFNLGTDTHTFANDNHPYYIGGRVYSTHPIIYKMEAACNAVHKSLAFNKLCRDTLLKLVPYDRITNGGQTRATSY